MDIKDCIFFIYCEFIIIRGIAKFMDFVDGIKTQKIKNSVCYIYPSFLSYYKFGTYDM